jgi:hypothetical protein
MSNLTYIQKDNFNKILKNNGYVLDFSDNTFKRFFQNYGINIFDPKYSEVYSSSSKGKCLNAFIDIEENALVIKVLRSLLEYRKRIESIQDDEQELYISCVNALDELENKTLPISISELKNLTHLHIQEQIDKCQEKIQSEDYSGAITNARTLLEHLFEYIYKELTNQEFDSDKLTAKYKALSKNLNLDPAHLETSTDELKQILSGFISIVNGFSCFRNDWSDSHARKYNPEKHHAQLAVNSAFTLCEFLLSSYEYQKNEKEKH